MEWVEPLAGPTGDCGPSIYSGGKVFVATLDRNFYAITADGSIERRANTPIMMDRSGSTTHAILCGLKGYIYAFCGDGDIWRYDPRTDSWGGAPISLHSVALAVSQVRSGFELGLCGQDDRRSGSDGRCCVGLCRRGLVPGGLDADTSVYLEALSAGYPNGVCYD